MSEFEVNLDSGQVFIYFWKGRSLLINYICKSSWYKKIYEIIQNWVTYGIELVSGEGYQQESSFV